MRHDPNITPQGSEICGSQSNHGIMKVDGAFAKRGSPTAKADLADGISRAKGHDEHPQFVGERTCAPETWVGKEASAMIKTKSQKPKRLVEIDTAKYQKYLDDSSLDEAGKQETVEAIWSIIVNFVDLGFEVHPLQQAQGKNSADACGQLTDPLDRGPDKDSNESKPVETLTEIFERASDDT